MKPYEMYKKNVTIEKLNIINKSDIEILFQNKKRYYLNKRFFKDVFGISVKQCIKKIEKKSCGLMLYYHNNAIEIAFDTIFYFLEPEYESYIHRNLFIKKSTGTIHRGSCSTIDSIKSLSDSKKYKDIETRRAVKKSLFCGTCKAEMNTNKYIKEFLKKNKIDDVRDTDEYPENIRLF